MRLETLSDLLHPRRHFRRKREPTLVLSEEQCDFFQTNGFLSIPAITTPEEVREIRAIYDRLYATKAGWKDGNFFDFAGYEDDPDTFKVPQLQMMSRYAPELFETLYYANAEAASRQLLGRGARHLYDHGIAKPPHAGGVTPWHQDIAFLDGESWFESLAVWMPLQPVDRTNGCLSYIPGSHLGPIVEHRSPGGDTRINGLEVVAIDASTAVACPLPAGGAVFHHGKTLHYADGNHSAEPRRALAWGFGIRRKEPVVPGVFSWIAAKDNERLHRWNAGRVFHRAKRFARSRVNRLLAGG